MSNDRVYTMLCRKSFTKSDGSRVDKGTVFDAKVKAYHSGALEFFSLIFPDNPTMGATEIPCVFARFHSVDEPSTTE
jgi:hypothetical protein